MKARELQAMLALYLSPIYIVLNVYLLLRMMRWMGACHHICEHPVVRIGFIILYILLATSLLTGFLLPEGELKRICKLIGNYWLGLYVPYGPDCRFTAYSSEYQSENPSESDSAHPDIFRHSWRNLRRNYHYP